MQVEALGVNFMNTIHFFLIGVLDWRDGAMLKGTGYSFKDPEFSS